MQVSVEKRASVNSETDLFAVLTTSFNSENWRLPPRWAEIDGWVDGNLKRVVDLGDFSGKAGQTVRLYSKDGTFPKRIILVGIGNSKEVGPKELRNACSRVIEEATKLESRRVAILPPLERRLSSSACLQAMSEGFILGGYRYDQYQTAKDKPKLVAHAAILIETANLRTARRASGAGIAIAESQNLARDLSNQPPCDLNPVTLAEAAKEMAKATGLRCKIEDLQGLKKLKMGAMLAVAQGSSNPPRLITLEHNAPKPGQKSRRPTVCLIGKGVTFDSGGLSLKPSGSMVTMKHDMSGGATVIGAMRACALLRLPIHVVGIVGAVENMPSGTAYRPDDVVTSASGKTIEIGNTDAEGRLVLADALHYARTTFEPDALIDLATLTGACVIALGKWCAGVLANNEALASRIQVAGETTSERFWQLPLWEDHRKFIKSHIADVKQVGGREAGTITAAAFLSHFVGDTPWAHLDIAGVANTDQASSGQPRGATGFGVRALIELLQNWKKL